jgi:hypothetical protein
MPPEKSVLICKICGFSFESSSLKNNRDHIVHGEKLHRSVLSVYWYERVGYRYSFVFIYEPRFITDSVVEKLCCNPLFNENLKNLFFAERGL